MKDSKKSSLLGHRLRFRWLFLFSLFAGPLALPLGGQSAIAANNIAQQQKVSVTGKVVDNLGEPIIGASVVVKGTSNGTITDFEGNFQLNTEKKGSLVISYIGYVTKEVTIKPTLKIVLAEDTKALDEVVVVGYGTQKKSDLTGSVTSVKAAEITAVTSNNPLESLQGRAPGVAVFTNNAPGESPILRIRGAGSIQSGNDPLYVVDGFPLMNGSLNDINPADIASIEVLKDASATAIYGSRAANGVVMITTKQGDKNKSRINFTANLSVQSVNNTIDVADADLFTWGVRQSKAADGKSLTNLAWGEQYAGQLQTIDWQKEMTRTALSRNYRLSASGGSSTSNYMASIGYTKNDGTIINSWYERITARANAVSKIRDFLTVNTNLAYVRTGSHGGGNMRSYALTVPTMDHLDENGNLMNVPIKYPDGSYGVPLQEMNGGCTER